MIERLAYEISLIWSYWTCSSVCSESNSMCLTLILPILNWTFQLEIDKISSWVSDWFLKLSKLICCQKKELGRVNDSPSIITGPVTFQSNSSPLVLTREVVVSLHWRCLLIGNNQLALQKRLLIIKLRLDDEF